MSEDWKKHWNAGAKTPYIAEIVRQATYALAAVDQALHLNQDPERHSGAWLAVQSFLTATANISKLLWPAGVQKDDTESRWRKFRAERLRADLEVDESSALKDRKVRNSADHFDERIDDVVRDQQIPESWTALSDENFVRLSMPFRAINSSTGEVIAGHDRMALQPVVAELKVLLQRCADAEPRAIGDLDVVAVLTALRWPPFPSLFAPSERPDEPVTAGATVDTAGPQTLEELITLVADQLRKDQSSTEPPSGSAERGQRGDPRTDQQNTKQ